MEMQQIRDGLWRWTAPHPDWKPSPTGSPGDWAQYVGSVMIEPPQADAPLVLVDPIVPPAGTIDEAALWKALDAASGRRNAPVAVVLANSFHHRSSGAVLRRYRERPGAEIWALDSARPHLDKVGCAVTHWYRDGSTLPGGLKAYEIEGLCPGEAILVYPWHGALVTADGLLGVEGGGLQLPPVSWAADAELYHKKLRPSLRRVLEEPFELVLVSHGEPVLEDGHHAVEAALR